MASAGKWLTKAVNEGKIMDGTTSTGTPFFWRQSLGKPKRDSGETNIVYSPETGATPNILNRDYFAGLNKKYGKK
jgi:hypothetical protein